MPNIAIPNLEFLRSENPRLAEALDYLARSLQNVSTQTGADPTHAQSEPPPQVQGVSVSSSGGIFDVKIDDAAPVNRNINYFVEYSETPGFQRPTPVDMGASRNIRLALGAKTLYWRAYSQYRSSEPSPSVYHGTITNPQPVSGGGSVIGPPLSDSAGSGTASNNGTQGGYGFGKNPVRSS